MGLNEKSNGVALPFHATGKKVVCVALDLNYFVAMLVACLIGLAVPAVLHRLKLDPKIAAGPVSLALADVFTLTVYFNLAKLVL